MWQRLYGWLAGLAGQANAAPPALVNNPCFEICTVSMDVRSPRAVKSIPGLPGWESTTLPELDPRETSRGELEEA